MRILTPKDIGAAARDARLELGMTQTDLAAKIGASRFWVGAFEQGKPGAEIGLALKALKALRLVLTAEPETHAQRKQDGIDTGIGHQPVIDLSSILRRTATPLPSVVPRKPQRRETSKKRTRGR